MSSFRRPSGVTPATQNLPDLIETTISGHDNMADSSGVHAAVSEAVQQQRPKMVFLTSPNNPDGSMIAEEDLLAILKLPVLVVLDEAYIEFAAEPSRLRWVLDHPNLVIFRTFSKSAGLAGLRVGYGESHPSALTAVPDSGSSMHCATRRLAAEAGHACRGVPSQPDTVPLEGEAALQCVSSSRDSSLRSP